MTESKGEGTAGIISIVGLVIAAIGGGLGIEGLLILGVALLVASLGYIFGKTFENK